MINLIKSEFVRVLISFRLYLVLFLVTFLFVLPALREIKLYTSSGLEMGALFYFSVGHASPVSILGILAPILVTLVFANTYALERNSGFLQFVSVRTNLSRYLFAKFVTNATIGGLIIAIPLSLTYLIYLIIFGSIPYPNPVGGAFGELAVENPTLYGWIRIFISSIFGVVYATVGLAFSALFKKPLFSNIIPFLLFLLPAMIFPFFGLDRFEPSTTWSPNIVSTTTIPGVFLQLFIIFVISIMVFYFGHKVKGLEYEKSS